MFAYKMFLIKIFKYLYHKTKNGSKVKFPFSSLIGIHSTFEGMSQIFPHTYFNGHLGYGYYLPHHGTIVIGDSNLIGKYSQASGLLILVR